ncbi:MAG: helix-turn-helix domain-containing protein, partial [Eubacteriales bacterium]|nr:helix-turn-helix domain-containing protein [Eubacteriales bacterium]
MTYNLNQVAMITGLTTRTLRNHLKQGILKGNKIDGNWSFTEEEVETYIGDPGVRQAISAKQHAVIYDFLADPYKKTNRICTIMDFP